MIRAFIAIPFEDAAQSAIMKIVDELQRGAGHAVKWVDKDNLHLTLKFLGNINEDQIQRVKNAMDALKTIDIFTMDLYGIGAFPSVTRPRVIWIGIKQKEEAKALFDRIEESISDINREDRPFSAHITIGRVKDKFDSRGLEKVRNLWNDKIICRSIAERVTLFQSMLSPKGSVYRVLYEVNLKKEAL